MNEQVIKKYNIPVPRYTSYPPANYFKELNDTDYLSAVDASNDANRNHVSFCAHNQSLRIKGNRRSYRECNYLK